MSTTTKQLKQSETVTIKRSQINLNPLNPKRHSEDKIKFQKRNLKDFGFVGGIVWNARTHNLIDGHRRIMAMDDFFGYDGTPETDYDVKVERVDVDEQQEREQMTYMALGNTKADYSLVADYINDIDVSKIGVDKNELDAIIALSEHDLQLPEMAVEEIDLGVSARQQPQPQDEPESATTYDEKKEAVIAAKQATKAKAIENDSDNTEAYITLSFSSNQSKLDFCDLIGIDADSKFAKGEEVLSMIE